MGQSLSDLTQEAQLANMLEPDSRSGGPLCFPDFTFLLLRGQTTPQLLRLRQLLETIKAFVLVLSFRFVAKGRLEERLPHA